MRSYILTETDKTDEILITHFLLLVMYVIICYIHVLSVSLILDEKNIVM